MAAEALTAFLQRDFSRTDQTLLTLTSDSPTDLHDVKTLTDDPRIKHNALVAKFYSTTSIPDLDNIIFYVSEFLPPDQRPASVDDFFSNTVPDQSALKFLYTHVGPVALYNVAVIAYHQRLIHAAATVGELLFDNIEAMDDWLALNTCFLLTDIHLRLARVRSVLTVLAYAEKLLPSFAKPSHPSSENPSSQPSAHVRTLAPPWPGRETAILEPPASYEHAKFCMHIYNARLSAASDGADGSRSIRKEAKSAVLAADDAHSRPTSAALLVKARVEQSYSKGLRILASIVNQCPPHMLSKVRPLALNSLGVLHHRLGRHALAACYFEHSRRSFTQLFRPPDAVNTEKHVYLSVFNAVKDTHVAYNLALQYMKFGDYSRALDLFNACARTDHFLASHSPRLWVRMAECCVGMRSASAEPSASVKIAGHGRGRRIIARSAVEPDPLPMEYAATCARAAIAIMNENIEENDEGTSESKQKRSGGLPLLLSVKNTKEDGGEQERRISVEERELRAAAWTLVAYASLCFDANAVIEACDELHKLYPKSETERCTLGVLYAAEAYCMLGRPKDAAKRLAPLLSVSVPLESHIREAAYVNIGLTHASSEDLVTASRAARVALKLYTSGPKRARTLRREAIFAAAYVFLRNGEVDAARQTLRMLY